MAKLKFGIAQISNPTPTRWARISSSLRYFIVSLIATVSATDVVPPTTLKWTVLALSVAVLLLKAIDKGLGIEEEKKEAA